MGRLHAETGRVDACKFPPRRGSAFLAGDRTDGGDATAALFLRGRGARGAELGRGAHAGGRGSGAKNLFRKEPGPGQDCKMGSTSRGRASWTHLPSLGQGLPFL